jgi:hypothetical protein
MCEQPQAAVGVRKIVGGPGRGEVAARLCPELTGPPTQHAWVGSPRTKPAQAAQTAVVREN